MPRLREVNPKLDNQLKNINSKILAAARVSTDSETYRTLKAQVEMIAKATGQDNLATKTVNGKGIPQLSRANSYYSGLKAGNRIQVQSLVDAVRNQSITEEMKRFAQTSGTGYAKTNAFKKEFKNVLAEQALQRKKDRLLSGDSDIADLLKGLPVGTTSAFSETLFPYMFGEYYNEQGFISELDRFKESLDEDIETYEAKRDGLKRDLDAETDAERVQSLLDELERTETDLGILENKRMDLGDLVANFMARDSYSNVISQYYNRR